jgi:hypothetical protein
MTSTQMIQCSICTQAVSINTATLPRCRICLDTPVYTCKNCHSGDTQTCMEHTDRPHVCISTCKYNVGCEDCSICDHRSIKSLTCKKQGPNHGRRFVVCGVNNCQGSFRWSEPAAGPFESSIYSTRNVNVLEPALRREIYLLEHKEQEEENQYVPAWILSIKNDIGIRIVYYTSNTGTRCTFKI